MWSTLDQSGTAATGSPPATSGVLPHPSCGRRNFPSWTVWSPDAGCVLQQLRLSVEMAELSLCSMSFLTATFPQHCTVLRTGMCPLAGEWTWCLMTPLAAESPPCCRPPWYVARLLSFASARSH